MGCLRCQYFNTAWRLTIFAVARQTQAEMLYDGLGNRLQMTAYSGGQSVTTQYELDNGRVLSADPSAGPGQGAAGNVTYSLYGLGPIGELTTTWNYSLPDGTGTPRQLTDSAGDSLRAGWQANQLTQNQENGEAHTTAACALVPGIGFRTTCATASCWRPPPA